MGKITRATRMNWAGSNRRHRLLAGVPSIVVLLAAGPAFAQTKPPADTRAAASADSDIVVTGSRIATNGDKAPTPVTTVATDQLKATTPSNLPDALNKLPVFQGSSKPRNPGDGRQNGAANVLNLRNFGAQRTLILLDGNRVTPSNANGTVDIDTIPQMLVKQVDVVTGGASAVYGSDAVTGVVNFVLDKKFTGLKVEANSGISTYGDGQSYQVGVAFGAKLFNDRGHFLFSARHQYQDPVANLDRAYGRGVYVLTGSGTSSAPFTVTANTRRGDSSFGGKINSCVAPCSALGQQFVANGVLGPFDPGTLTKTGNQNSGGDGAYSVYSTALVKFRNDEVFGRLDYDVTSNVNFYVQGSYAVGFAKGAHFPVKLTPVGGTPTVSNSTASVFFKNNPFLSPAVQAALGNNGLFNNTNTFSVGTYMTNLGEAGTVGSENLNRYLQLMTGFTGTLGRFRWDLNYTHGENRLKVSNLNNTNYQRQFAALDAVTAPDGSIKCYAALQPATASQYAGCVPLNAFGPTAITPDMFRWFTQTTYFKMNNTMDDIDGSISGDLLKGWAGPIRVALSAEYRRNGYSVRSNANPNALVDCTGLRICNPNLALWAQPVLGQVDAHNSVWEVAGELELPLLRDLPFARSFVLNAAGRQTHYSTSGDVQTWKVGAVWEVVDGLRFRGATSVDIRAPTLNDLFQPVQAAVQGFVDQHTGLSATTYFATQGNPDLVPERAKTYTIGVVAEPRFLPGFSLSVDYYSIRLNNAISQVSPNTALVQQICESSNGTDPYCQLLQRPLPFSDRSVNNFPTRVFALNLNTAYNKLEGWDVEAGYAHGDFSTRLFANYQPTNESVAIPGQPISQATATKLRLSGFAAYHLGEFTLGLQDTWLSGFSTKPTPTTVTNIPHIRPFNTLDATLSWDIKSLGGKVTPYFNVQNLLNAKPQILPPAGSIGLLYPVPAGYDIMGRYFTFGFKAKF